MLNWLEVNGWMLQESHTPGPNPEARLSPHRLSPWPFYITWCLTSRYFFRGPHCCLQPQPYSHQHYWDWAIPYGGVIQLLNAQELPAL